MIATNLYVSENGVKIIVFVILRVFLGFVWPITAAH